MCGCAYVLYTYVCALCTRLCIRFAWLDFIGVLRGVVEQELETLETTIAETSSACHQVTSRLKATRTKTAYIVARTQSLQHDK